MQSAVLLMSWPISPHWQSESTLHESSPAVSVGCTIGGGLETGVELDDDGAGGMTTVVGSAVVLRQAARASASVSAGERDESERFIRSRLYTLVMQRFAPVLALALGCARGEAIESPPPLRSEAKIPFVLETSAGVLRCEIDAARAPRAAAMVIGLAAGEAAFRDPTTQQRVARPYYDGLSFFRAIPGVLVQTGCPVGAGSGTPGDRIAVETSPGVARRLAQPGALLLARYQPPPGRVDPHPPRDTIGSQLVIALDDMSHLAGQVTVLGACGDLDVVRRISTEVAAGREVRVVHARAR